MVIGILFILILIVSAYTFIFYPNQKLQRIRDSTVLEVDGADTRYPDLPLGRVGIFCGVNERRKIRIVFPKLTPEGDVQYIYSWHNLYSVHVPTIEETGRDGINLKTAQELTFLIREHIQFVEPEIQNLKKQWLKISDLIDLVSTSEFYSSQQGIYERALFQVENLLNKAEELQQVYVRFIREMLIARKVAGYDPNLLPDKSVSIDKQYEGIREEFQNMKELATAYSELLHTRQI